jgi:hypothetical protein
MVDVPTKEPTEFAAGDTIKWTRELADYPASASWVLTYALRNAVSQIDVTASAVGDVHSITIAASVSAAFAPGSYGWAAYVSKAGERYEVGTGTLTIRPNLAAKAPLDTRTQARKAADDLNVALSTFRSSGGRVKRYRIGDREMEFESVTELLTLLRRWEAVAQAEEKAAALASGSGLSSGRLQVRF